MENERILQEQQIENEKEHLKNTKEDKQHNHDKEMTILKGKKNKQIMNERVLEESRNQNTENLKQNEIQHEERIKKEDNKHEETMESQRLLHNERMKDKDQDFQLKMKEIEIKMMMIKMNNSLLKKYMKNHLIKIQ